MKSPLEWSGNNHQASIDCRDLVKSGATHVMSVCHNNANDPLESPRIRINNLHKETISNPTDLWDVNKDECQQREVHNKV